MTTSSTVEIGRLPKNRTDVVVISLSNYEGVDLVDIRINAAFDNGEPRPTKRGVSLKLGKLPDLIGLLQRAESEARSRGLLDPEEHAA